jgi:hypothetical protein
VSTCSPRARTGRLRVFYAALDLFDTLAIEWSQSPARELQLLQSAEIETRRHRIAFDLERYRAASTVLELVSLGAPEATRARACSTWPKELSTLSQSKVPRWPRWSSSSSATCASSASRRRS